MKPLRWDRALERALDRARYVAGTPRDALRLARATLSNRARGAWERAFPGTGADCNLCGWTGRRFEYFLERHFVVKESQCPRCGTQPRHRAMLEHLLAAAAPGATLLDVGPVPGYAARLRAAGFRCVGIDLGSHRAVDARMDLGRLALPDGAVDVVLCSHVLEHVPPVDAALRELHRVLRPGGVALVDVPRRAAGPTLPIDPPDHQGHAWDFGADFQARLAAAGFRVDERPYGPRAPGETFFHCVRR